SRFALVTLQSRVVDIVMRYSPSETNTSSRAESKTALGIEVVASKLASGTLNETGADQTAVPPSPEKLSTWVVTALPLALTERGTPSPTRASNISIGASESGWPPSISAILCQPETPNVQTSSSPRPPLFPPKSTTCCRRGSKTIAAWRRGEGLTPVPTANWLQPLPVSSQVSPSRPPSVSSP